MKFYDYQKCMVSENGGTLDNLNQDEINFLLGLRKLKNDHNLAVGELENGQIILVPYNEDEGCTTPAFDVLFEEDGVYIIAKL